MAEHTADVFRQEALTHHAGHQREGDVLRLSPAWTRWSYWLLCAVSAAGLLYAALGQVYQYAGGPAVVRAEGRLDLSARAAGLVAAIEVHPGQRVGPGQVLVRFDTAVEAQDLERTRSEFELLLLRTLRDPTDQAARQALTTLRAQQELARARLEERSVRAPRAGIVSDIRIRQGQHLAAGDVVVSLIDDRTQFWLLALLPGHARPLLRPGMPLRVEMSGYRYEYQELTIDSIADEVVGPAEVRRYLPQEIADAVALEGPVALVRARLPAPTFLVDGHEFRYHEGMLSTAEARVRAERILVTLIPALKALGGSTHANRR